MSTFKLIYFKNCPNYQPAQKLLSEIGLEFQNICQDDLGSRDPLKNYTSPTLLMGEKIIFGSKATGGGCSMPLPAKAELLRLIQGN